MNDLTDIGKRIKQVRESLGHTQGIFGDLLGLSPQAISKYEKGRADPGCARIQKISDLGGKSVNWLITGENEKPLSREITTEDLAAELIARPKLREMVEQRIRLEVHEEFTDYGDKNEQRMIQAWRVLPPDQQRIMLRCMEEEAKESRRNVGGGSDCADQNSA